MTVVPPMVLRGDDVAEPDGVDVCDPPVLKPVRDLRVGVDDPPTGGVTGPGVDFAAISLKDIFGVGLKTSKHVFKYKSTYYIPLMHVLPRF